MEYFYCQHLYRNNRFVQITVVFATALLMVSFALIGYRFTRSSQVADVLGIIFCGGISPCENTTQPAVTVSGFIRIKEVNIIVHPEKRQPATGNWGTTAKVIIENCSNGTQRIFNAVVTNDVQGFAKLNISSSNPLQNGSYRFFVRGKSHLNERFNCYAIVSNNQTIDLTVEGKDLLAGEVSNIYDNHINSLDLSGVIRLLFTNDDSKDLNQDTKVNSLDVSNTIYNIFKTGD